MATTKATPDQMFRLGNVTFADIAVVKAHWLAVSHQAGAASFLTQCVARFIKLRTRGNFFAGLTVVMQAHQQGRQADQK